MMVHIISWLEALAQDVFQIVLLAILAPFIAWCLRCGPAWFGGIATVSPYPIITQHLAFWHRGWKVGFSGRDSVCLAALLTVMAVLPAITTDLFWISLADPLLVGVLLLAIRSIAVPPFTALVRDGRIAGNTRTGIRPLVPAFLLLCLVEALSALSASGADGLGGLCAILHIEPGPGLEGALAACALALGIICPPLRHEDVIMALSDVRDREDRNQRRVLVELVNCGWVLFLSDLAFPSGIALPGSGVTGWFSGLGLLGARLILVVLVLGGLRTTGQERSSRLTALFAGLALLIALAGRFAT